MYTRFLLTILAVLCLMSSVYSNFAQPKTVEPFAGLHYPFRAQHHPTIEGENGCQSIHGNINSAAGNYGGPSYVEPSGNVMDGSNMGGIGGTDQSAEGFNNPYYARQNLESAPPPRFDDTSSRGGVQITYGLENNDMMAAPSYPLQNTDAEANMQLNNNEMNQGFDDVMGMANQVEGFEQQVQQNFENVETKFVQVHEPIPLPKTIETFQEPAGSNVQFKVVDRLMFSTGKNRNEAFGDPIRGDLHITPDPSHCGRFQTAQSLDPAGSVKRGALHQIAGMEPTVYPGEVTSVSTAEPVNQSVQQFNHTGKPGTVQVVGF